MGAKRTIHVAGMGTIGKPLINALLKVQRLLEIDEVTFDVQRDSLEKLAHVECLMRRGGKLAVDADTWLLLTQHGVQPDYDTCQALEQATVVIDSSFAEQGNPHARERYAQLPAMCGLIAQGSESGFGKMYARGINDAALEPENDRFIRVVSGPAHTVAVLTEALALHDEEPDNLIEGRFVCMSRARTPNQEVVHLGTREAWDTWRVFQTLSLDLDLFSWSLQLRENDLPCVLFRLQVKRATTRDEVLAKLAAHPNVGLSQRTINRLVYASQRHHGRLEHLPYRTTVEAASLHVQNGHDIVGIGCSPHKGYALRNNIAAAAWLLAPDTYAKRIQEVESCLFDGV